MHTNMKPYKNLFLKTISKNNESANTTHTLINHKPLVAVHASSPCRKYLNFKF